jgi:DNA-binding beta-propeller fold protein YncE
MSKLLMQSLKEFRVVDTVEKKVETLQIAELGDNSGSVYDFAYSSTTNCLFMVDNSNKISWHCLQHGENGIIEEGNINGLTISNDGRLLYGLISSGVITVDAFSKTIVDRIGVDLGISDKNAPLSMNVSPDGKMLYIFKHNLIEKEFLYEIDLENKIMARSLLIYHEPMEEIFFFPHWSEISHDGKTLFMLKPNESAVTFINLESFKEEFNVRVHNEAAGRLLRYNPQSLVLNADGKKLYVACYKDKVNKVSVIDTINKKVLRLLSTTSKPRALSVNKKNGALYVACQDGVLMIFDTANDELINMLPGSVHLDHIHFGHMGIIDGEGTLEVDPRFKDMDIDRLPPVPNLPFDDEALLRVAGVVDTRQPVEKIQNGVRIWLRDLKTDVSMWGNGVPEFYILYLQSMSREALYLATDTMMLGNTWMAISWFKAASMFDEIGLTYQRKRISTWYDEALYCRDALYHAILSKDREMISRIADLTFHIDSNWPEKYPDCAYLYHYIQALASLSLADNKDVSGHIANMNVVKGRTYNKKKVEIKKRCFESIFSGDRESFIVFLNELLAWHYKLCRKRSPMPYDLFAFPEISLALVAKGTGIELKPENIDEKLRPYIMWELF